MQKVLMSWILHLHLLGSAKVANNMFYVAVLGGGKIDRPKERRIKKVLRKEAPASHLRPASLRRGSWKHPMAREWLDRPSRQWESGSKGTVHPGVPVSPAGVPQSHDS